MRTNRYPGPCISCGGYVPKGRGSLQRNGRRWAVRCHACGGDDPQSKSVSAYFPSTGTTVYRNRAGRCEDAPCCGCCS